MQSVASDKKCFFTQVIQKKEAKGQMSVFEVQKMAKSLGIEDFWRRPKDDLIKMIQLAEGNFDCFGSGVLTQCNQADCLWRSDCLK